MSQVRSEVQYTKGTDSGNYRIERRLARIPEGATGTRDSVKREKTRLQLLTNTQHEDYKTNKRKAHYLYK